MATPRSAGRVLIRPLGDYNAATTYEMLDSVEYEGSTYLCKQTSTGNLPINKTYWQKMISVGADDFMAIDGSNATVLDFAEDQTHDIDNITITKPAGEDQTVSLVISVPYNSVTGKLPFLIANDLKAHIGDTSVFYRVAGSPVYINLQSATVSSVSYDGTADTVTATAKLVNDDANEVELYDKSITLNAYISENVDRGMSFGYGTAVSGNLSISGGRQTSVSGTRAFAYGEGVGADSYGHAEGQKAYAGLSAHAEGKYTTARGEASHAEGTGTVAPYSNQHVQGKFNNPKVTTLFEIGNGTAATRANAFEIYDDGALSFNEGVDKYKFAKSGGVNGFYDGSNNFHPIESFYLTQSVTLSTSADTTVTFNNANITTDSMIDVYTDTYGVNPSDVAVTTGTCTLTFAKVSTAQTISVRIEIKNV